MTALARIGLLLAVLLAATVPASAQVLATPGSLALTYLGPGFPAPSASATITKDGQPAAITSTSLISTPANVFYVVPSGNTVYVGMLATAPSVLGTATSASGTLTVNVTGGSVAIALSLTVSTAGTPLISASQSTLALSANIGQSASTSVTLTSSVSGVAFTATANTPGYASPWLLVSSSSLTTPATLAVVATAAGLGTGIYSGTIDIADSTSVIVLSITVSFTVGFGGPIFGGTNAQPSALSFAAQTGAAAPPAAQQIYVTGPAGATFQGTATTTTGQTWLSASPTSGSVPGIIIVAANASGLTAGTYTGSVTIITSTGAAAFVSVTLTVTSTPVPVTNVGSILLPALNYSTPVEQTLAVASSGSPQQFTYQVGSNASWIQVTAGNTGSTPGTVTLSINAAAAPVGTPGIVTITNAATGMGVQIPVLVASTAASSVLSLNPTAVTLPNATAGSVTLVSAQVSVTSGTAALPFSAVVSSFNTPWLTVSANSSVTPATLTILGNAAGLQPGTYSGTITVSSGTASQSIPVSFTITSGGVVQPTITASPAQFNFEIPVGGSSVSRDLSLTSTGTAVTFAAVPSNANWLTVEPATGQTPATIRLTASIAGLAVGSYTGALVITPLSGGGSALSVPVSLTVRAAPALSLSTADINFSYRTDGAAPAAQTLAVTSTGTAVGFAAAATSAGWLTVSPTFASTPATLSIGVNPLGLAPGSYTGTISLTPAGAAAPSHTLNVRLVVTGPLPTITQVANAASYEEGRLAPGEIVIVRGTALGPASLTTMNLTAQGRVPRTLSAVRVLFSGVEAPVLYVSASQGAAIVPYWLAGRNETFVQVEYNGVRSNAVTVPLALAVPGIFTANASGTGPGAILNEDGSYNGPNNAAPRGSIVSLYITGEGQTIPAGAEDQVTRRPNLPAPVLPVSVSIGGQRADVLYAGAAPDQVAGLMQINARIPNLQLPAGATLNADVVVMVGNAASQRGVTVSVR